MGSLLTAAVPRLRTPEEANLRAPETVVSLHVSFINAGAELIETNSFGANRRKLAAQFLDDELERINSTAVKLAREARELTGRDVFIGGAIGPLGEGVAPGDRRSLFAEQAEILEGRGCDLILLETFYSLEELEAGIEAVRSVSALPLIALLSFDEHAQTLTGLSAAAAAARLQQLGLAAFGANHGAGLLAALHALEQMQVGGASLAVLPNIGLASLLGGRVIYPHAAPDYFAEFTAHARELGTRVIGGCCGTTPTEIAAIRAAIDGNHRSALQARCHRGRGGDAVFGEDLRETRLSQARARQGSSSFRSSSIRRWVRLEPGVTDRGRPDTPESSGLVLGSSMSTTTRDGARRNPRRPSSPRPSNVHRTSRRFRILTTRDHDGARSRVGAARDALGGRQERARGHRRPRWQVADTIRELRGVYEIRFLDRAHPADQPG